MNISKKRFATILLGSIFATAFLVSLVIAATPTTTFNISGGIYPGAADFTIWKESTNYFAKNKYGQIAYSGTDATDVIQAVLENTVAYGSIYFKTATYQIRFENTSYGGGSAHAPFNIVSPVSIIGETGALFQAYGTDWKYQYVMWFINRTDYVTIKNIAIDGDYDTISVGIYGIFGYDCQHCLIDSVRTYDIGYSDIYFAGSSGKDTLIIHCQSYGNGGATANVVYGNSASDITWAFNYVNNSKAPTGQAFYPSGNNTLILGNIVENVYSSGVTSYANPSLNGAFYTRIIDNTFINCNGSTVLCGSAGVVGGSNVIMGNRMVNDAVKNILELYTGNNTISGNIIETGGNGILIRSASGAYNNVYGNTIEANIGVYLYADAYANNTIHDNNVLNCATPITNATSYQQHIFNNIGNNDWID